MSRSVSLVLAAMLVGSSASPPSAPPSPGRNNREIVAVVERFNRALDYLDRDALLEMFAPDATMFLPSTAGRRRGRAAIGAELDSVFATTRAASDRSRGPYLDLRIEDVATRMIGANVGIATWHSVRPEYVGRTTVVLQRRDGEWHIVSFHGSNAAAAPAAPAAPAVRPAVPVPSTDRRGVTGPPTAAGAAAAPRAFMVEFDHLRWDAMAATFALDAVMFAPFATRRLDGLTGILAALDPLYERLRRSRTGPRYLQLEPLDLDVQMMGTAAVVTWHFGTPPVGQRTAVVEYADGAWRIVSFHASTVRSD